MFFRSLPTDNLYIYIFLNVGPSVAVFDTRGPRCHWVQLVLDTQINGNIAFIFRPLCPSASSPRLINSFALPATYRCTGHAGTVCLTERIPNIH